MQHTAARLRTGRSYYHVPLLPLRLLKTVSNVPSLHTAVLTIEYANYSLGGSQYAFVLILYQLFGSTFQRVTMMIYD